MPAAEPDGRTNGLSGQLIATRASGASFILEDDNTRRIFSYFARYRCDGALRVLPTRSDRCQMNTLSVQTVE